MPLCLARPGASLISPPIITVENNVEGIGAGNEKKKAKNEVFVFRLLFFIKRARGGPCSLSHYREWESGGERSLGLVLIWFNQLIGDLPGRVGGNLKDAL